jgi:diguanylate cyclase (GGDEF)-like protein
MAILPLLVSGDAVGVLALYAGEVGFFDGDEMKLLRELAGDISFALEHIEKTEKLDYLAYYDELTGIANRSLFLQRLEERLLAERGSERRVAVTVIDIERLAAINDAFGRQAGEQLLQQVADRLKRVRGDATRLARVGAECFAVLSAGVENENDVARMTEHKLGACFEQPFRIADQELRIPARVGIALYPNDAGDAENLLRCAEAALKKARDTGERYLFFTPNMTERIAERLSLENKLRRALEKDEFVLHYQPKVDLVSRDIKSVEALIRWRSPELGLVPPMEFIPLLEETGLILEVGTWALKRAARDHRGWVQAGLRAPRVAVNVSPLQLRQRDFVGVVEQAIIEGVAPTGIDLEITESLIMKDIQGNIEKLNAIRGLGVGIAIDDFGTGYSSLAYLAMLPVETLKIDRAFIVKMTQEPNASMLVQTMISLAHSLRLKVVAEGVETEEQANLLRLLRCDQMQGYLFSKPLPAEELVALLRTKPAAPGSGVASATFAGRAAR